MLLLIALLACDEPAPVAVPSAAPGVDTLEDWLGELGQTPRRDGDVLRVAHVGADAAFEVRVVPMPDEQVVWLSTSPLVTLRDAAGERGIVLLLTNLAVLNHELVEGKLQLDPATGDVVLSIELPTDDGLGKATFQSGVRTLVRAAEKVGPRLREAAVGPEL